MVDAVAITANRQVATRHHELKLPSPRLTKNRNRLFLAIASRIVLQLLFNPIVPVGCVETPEQGLDHILLVLGIEPAGDFVVTRDLPVV